MKTLSFLFQHSHIVYTNYLQCVKSVRIRSYSGPYFPAFGQEGHFLRSDPFRADPKNNFLQLS